MYSISPLYRGLKDLLVLPVLGEERLCLILIINPALYFMFIVLEYLVYFRYGTKGNVC